ncbi:SGNH hydrolase domain-containing protein, partial [Brevundimonas sp.]|uniref:SGNH hydrolase domain-containing protein n=1 Tax=Brevundimonas sp. TaxID=1871086 RepID=UPI002D531B85
HTEGAALPAAHPCTVPAEADADVVLWGNSHADHLSPAVLAWARQRGLAVRQATRSGCLPLLRERAGVASDDCAAFNRSAVAEWGREAPQVVIVNAAPTLPRGGVSADTARQLDVLFGELAHTLRMLRAQVGPRTLIVLLGTTPEYAFAPASCHARRAFLGLTTGMCDRAVPANAELAGVVDERLTALAAAEAGVAVYRPWTALCDRGGCRTRGPNGPWYRDGRHLTAAGGRAQSQALARLLNERFPGGR